MDFSLTELHCYQEFKDAMRLQRSLGTLGGGNHFIEFDGAEDGTLYLMMHSGSCNMGKQVAEYDQSLAVQCNEGYKAYLLRGEIQKALKQLPMVKLKRTLPDDLRYVSGRHLEDYLVDMISMSFWTRFDNLVRKTLL